MADGGLRNIYQVDAAAGVLAQLLPFGTTENPVALAYDSTNELLYWTDFAMHTINRYSLLTNNSIVIYGNSYVIGKLQTYITSSWFHIYIVSKNQTTVSF